MQSRKTCHLAIAYASYLLEFDDIFEIELHQPKFGSLRSQLFDIGFANSYLNKPKIKPALLSATCVLMASKYFEIDDNLIQISEIQKFLQNSKKIERQFRVSFSEVTQTELVLLDRMSWDLNFILPLDFAQILCQVYSQKIQASQNDKILNWKSKVVQLQNDLELNLDKIMQSYEQFQFESGAQIAFCLFCITIDHQCSIDRELSNIESKFKIKSQVQHMFMACSVNYKNLSGKLECFDEATQYQLTEKIKQVLFKNSSKTIQEARQVDKIGQIVSNISSQIQQKLQIQEIEEDNLSNDHKQQSEIDKQFINANDKLIKSASKNNCDDNSSKHEIKDLSQVQVGQDTKSDKKTVNPQSSKTKLTYKQSLSELRQQDSSEIHSLRHKGSQTQMCNKKSSQLVSKIDHVVSLKLQKSPKQSSCLVRPFKLQSQSSQVKDISPINESESPVKINHELAGRIQPGLFDNGQSEFLQSSQLQEDQEATLNFEQSKSNQLNVHSKTRLKENTDKQFKQLCLDIGSDNDSEESEIVVLKKQCLSSRQKPNMDLINSKRCRYQSKSGQAEETKELIGSQHDSQTKNTKYAPLRKYDQNCKQTQDATDLDQDKHNNLVTQAQVGGHSTARQNSIANSLITQCMVSNLDCSATRQSRFTKSYRSDNRTQSHRQYTTQKDLHSQQDKVSNLQNNLAKKANNLKSIKNSSILQRNQAMRENQRAKLDKAAKQRVAIQSNNNRLLSKSPQQFVSDQFKLSEQDSKRQKNQTVFKQVDPVNPQSLKTFCEDLNIDSNLEVVHPISTANNNLNKAMEQLTYTRLAKKTGTVLGIRNNDGQAKVDHGQNAGGQLSQLGCCKKVQNQTAMERYHVRPTGDGLKPVSGLSINSSQRQFMKCKSIYFDKNKQASSNQQNQPDVSIKLLQNISNALSCEKLSIMDQYSKFNENKNSIKKKQYLGIQKQATTQLKKFFKCDDLASPQAGGANQNSKMFEKRGSYNFQKNDETISRIKNQGSFSLCMSSVKNKMRDKEINDKTVGHSLMTVDVKQDDKTAVSQKKIEFSHKVIKSDSQRQFPQYNKQKNLFSAKDNYLKVSQDSEYRAPQQQLAKGNSSAKKEHYLKILKAHNENYQHHSSKHESIQKKRQAILSTSSTTPVATESKLNYKSQQNSSNQNALRNARRNSKQDQVFSQLYSPKSNANPLDSSKISGITIPDKDFALKKSIAIDSFKGYNRHLSKNTSQKSILRQNSKTEQMKLPIKQKKIEQLDENELNCNSNSNTIDCDHYFTVTQQFDASRSRTNQVAAKQATNTITSIKSNTSLRQKTSSSLSKKSTSQKRIDLSINTNKKTNQKHLGAFNSLSDRQNIITPKQKTLNKVANRIETSVDKKTIKSIHSSSKNLHPRSFKNKYESSQKKGEQNRKRYLDSSNTRKQTSPAALKTLTQSKKMVVFSPSLQKDIKVIEYKNPFDSAGPSTAKLDGNRSRDKQCQGSNSTKRNLKENTFSATKLMSFVERRQINLKSDSNTKLEKVTPVKAGFESDRQTFATTSNQIKQTLRKFNLQAAEKLDQDAPLLSQNGSAKCLLLNQHQSVRTGKPTSSIQRSQSRRQVNVPKQNAQQNSSSGQKQYEPNSINKQKIKIEGSIQSIVQRSQKLRQQIHKSESSSPINFNTKPLGKRQLSNTRVRDSTQTLQAGNEGAAPTYTNEANQQQPLSARKYNLAATGLTIYQQQTSGREEIAIPKQIHTQAPSSSSKVTPSKNIREESQLRQKFMKERSKQKHSETKVNSKLTDVKVQPTKHNETQRFTDMLKLNDCQSTSRSIKQQAQTTKSPLNKSSKLHSYQPSTCESVAQYGLKSNQKNSRAGKQYPIIIQETQDQMETVAAPSNLELSKTLSQDQASILKSKKLRNILHQQQTNKTELITLTSRAQQNQCCTGPSWQSFSCKTQSADFHDDQSDQKHIRNRQLETEPAEENEDLASLRFQQVQLEQQGSEETVKKSKKQRRTAQERKGCKRLPNHQQN